MALIAPSLLATDFARLGQALQWIKEAGAPMVHVDVMDGHFVPEISVGQPVIKSVRKATDLALDLHLLIERPERYVMEFVSMGADRIAIHAEATPNLHQVLRVIRNGGAKAGLALNPSTAVASVTDLLEGIDFLLILSANLGFADAAFLPGTSDKVQAARALRQEKRLSFALEVEGGIGREHVEPLVAAGADILVAGSDIFQREFGTQLAQAIRQAAGSKEIYKV